MTAAPGKQDRAGDWQRDGWTLVSGFFGPAELESFQEEANRLLSRPALFAERGEVVNSARRSDRLDPVIDLSRPFADAARDARLAALVSDLLGGEAQLFKDKFIAKPPGAPGYSTHQDGAYWPGMGIDPCRFLTAVIYLDDADAANGAIECASGPHRRLLTDPDRVADPDEAAIGPFTVIEAKAGDVLLLHALTPHRSGTNRSTTMRRSLLFTYGIDDRPDLYAMYQRLRRGGE